MEANIVCYILGYIGFGDVGVLFRVQGFRDIITIMENQMEKKMRTTWKLWLWRALQELGMIRASQNQDPF